MAPELGVPGVEITVIAPMFNEEENVSSTVERISAAMNELGVPWEFVMVNDGSADGTLAAAQAQAAKDARIRVVSYPKNRGRGKALREGFKAARGRYILTTDFDLSYSPDHLVRMYRTLKENPDIDAVLGSAYMPGGRAEGVPWFRLFISRAGNRFIRMAMGGRFHTITCVLRGYRREVVQGLELQSDGKEIHLEILSKLVALGCNVVEIPAVLRGRSKGRSKFRFRRTSLSHLMFGLFEQPMMFFGAAGALLFLLGMGLGLFLLAVQRSGRLNPERPLMTVMIVFILAGIQMVCFGFLALQMLDLRRQMYIIQRSLRSLRREETDDDKG
ncbi:MAG TPA: glycosyltransferase [Candidatus Brocadiia bacterium]|nr:glycosyltransferase [Candidatus Brocadiia bacterium]